MGRAFSFSLIAHALFMLSFLLLSSTRTPLVIPQSARPVRLVAYLDPVPAPPRAPRGVSVSTPAPPKPRVDRPAAAAPPPPEIVVPRGRIPVPDSAAPVARKDPPPPEARPDLRQRLARRLAAASPAASPAGEAKAPQITALTRPGAPPVPAASIPGAIAPGPESIAPVGLFPHAWYLSVLREQVFSRWSPPSVLFVGKLSPAALVSFRIERDGRVGNTTLKESSGSARFDQSALAAVRGLGRVPPLPEQYTEESLDVVIRFQNEK